MGARVDVELENGERLSLRFPGAHASGGGACDCETLTAQLSDPRRRLLRERVFRSVEDLLGCLFQVAATEVVEPEVLEVSLAAEGTPSSGHPGDEIDVDVGDDLNLPVPAPDASDALPEGVEYLGSYSSIPAYLRAMLEPEVTRASGWILDHLDYLAVQRRWESDGRRLLLERGHVYRVTAVAGSSLGWWPP